MNEESEKSQDSRSEELYEWIETIPFSKPTKNLTRDFSDAVLMAEVLKVYYPRHVDLHNYVAASNINTKRENWNTLNRKVLIKIDMKLGKDTINQLANAHQGTIEKVLLELKAKISNQSNDIKVNAQDDSGKDEQRRDGDVSQTNLSEKSSLFEGIKEISVINSCFLSRWKTTTLYAVYSIIAWFCFWNWLRIPYNFVKGREFVAQACTERTEFNSEDDAVPRSLCTQLRQQLREKNDVICTLNHKVAYLESVMKLQDLRLSNLTSQILQNAAEMDQLTKNQSANGTAQAKSRPRSLNVQESNFS